jgi:hypothetical protein
VMLAQRPAGAAPAVRGVAEALPFGDGVFDSGEWDRRWGALLAMDELDLGYLVVTASA